MCNVEECTPIPKRTESNSSATPQTATKKAPTIERTALPLSIAAKDLLADVVHGGVLDGMALAALALAPARLHRLRRPLEPLAQQTLSDAAEQRVAVRAQLPQHHRDQHAARATEQQRAHLSRRKKTFIKIYMLC